MSLSIIIPYYNREKFLENTLASVSKQTYRPIELILVDNGSTDSSAEICRRFFDNNSSDDFTIKLVEEPEKGAGKARNTGAKYATNQYLYFFDSDDIMSPNFTADIIQKIKNSLIKYELIAVKTNIVLPNGKQYKRKSYYKTSVVDQIILSSLSTQSCVFRKDFFERIGKWNETLPCWNDWELGIRIMLNKPTTLWIKHPTYHMIISHPESITGNNFSERYRQIVKAIEQAKTHIADDLKAQKALTALQIIFLGNIYREGSINLSKEIYQQVSDSNHKIPLQRWFTFYCKHVGKGAWWIYINLISKLIF
jgi:glycosyltransferase involved in cell wall biosynthesis